MDRRPSYEIRFSDGGILPLGPVTRVMGILNVTPDSFSDGGRLKSPDAALDAAAAMLEAGADLIDVGGESTRPGADPVSEAEEIDRVVPVIERIRDSLELRVSVDTRKASVARAALDAGADLVNDVSGLGDPEMLPLVSKRRVPFIAMHMRGKPQTMQRDTGYADVVRQVARFLRRTAETAVAAGVSDGKIIVDPGIGFGKSAEGNLTILKQLPMLHRIGHPVLIGASRKSFIGKILDLPVDQRLEGSLAVAAFASAQGAQIIRAHDVAATVRVVRMIDAILES